MDIHDTRQNALLVLAGYHADAYASLQSLIKELDLGQFVICPGVVRDVTELLASVNLVAFSSVTEGCPNAVLEGMAAGLPVVGTDAPAIAEAVGPDALRHLAPPGNAEALAERILDFFRDPDLCIRSGDANRRRIAEEFSSETMALETASVFLQVATSGRFYNSI